MNDDTDFGPVAPKPSDRPLREIRLHYLGEWIAIDAVGGIEFDPGALADDEVGDALVLAFKRLRYLAQDWSEE